MKLEDEIKQPQFKTEHQKATVNLIYTYYWLWEKNKNFLKPFDITPQQFNVLRILRGQNGKPISTSDIRDRMLDKMSDVSRIVDRLYKQQLLVRKVCPTDKRLVDVSINDKGLQLLAAIDVEQQKQVNIMHLDDAELAQLNMLLDKARG